jgi:hypothetical protein
MLAQCDGYTLQILVYLAVRSHEAKFLSLKDGGVPPPQKLQEGPRQRKSWTQVELMPEKFAEQPRVPVTSIALEIMMYFGWWYDVAFCLAMGGIFIYKGATACSLVCMQSYMCVGLVNLAQVSVCLLTQNHNLGTAGPL